MQCDICGKEVPVMKANVEGTILNVCDNCAKFGKVLSKPEQAKPLPTKAWKPKVQEKQPEQIIVRNYQEIIKTAREKTGQKQEDFAKTINEKASVIHNMEAGRYEPPIELARKLEKALKIRIVEDYKEENKQEEKRKSEGLTIGDVINLG